MGRVSFCLGPTVIYALYDENGDRVGGCEIIDLDETRIAEELVKRTNAMVPAGTHRLGVEPGVRPIIGKDYQRYDILYLERGHVIEAFYAVPDVIGHA